MLRRKCVIGKYARIAFDSQFMDSDFHYMLNIEDGTVKNCTSFIEIGAYNWIGNRTTVKKGTVTPDYTIVAAPNAMLSKDYTKICSPFPILAGCPAKQIASGYRRVFNIQTERDLTESFKNDTGFIICDLSDNIDDFCNNHPKP